MDEATATKRATEELARGAAKSVAEPQDASNPRGPWQVKVTTADVKPEERTIRQ